MPVLFFKNAAELRQWLEAQHGRTSEQWIGFYNVKSGKESVTYAQALDQALCFGWIDGLRKNIDEASYKIRFTPRLPGSTWSEVNTRKALQLIEQNLMTAAGLRCFNERDIAKTRLYSYEQRTQELPEEYQAHIRANEKAWSFFSSQPAWYQRTAGWWILSAKKEETRQKRLAQLIEDSQNGQIIKVAQISKK